jgi:hypothetical protein
MEGRMTFNRFLTVFFAFCFVFPAFSNADQLEEAQAALDDKDFEKAYVLLSPLVEAENAEAQTKLGVMYINGQGVEADQNKGLKLITAAASQGYDVAQATALKLYMDIARDGNTGAMYNVGGMCLKGWGDTQDKNVCLEWLEGAARLGHIKSGEMLSKIYKEGRFGIPVDKEKASAWKSVARGFKKGMNGTWGGSISGTEGQPMFLSFTFKVEDNRLTGTTLDTNRQNIPLEDCKIDGNDFSFKVLTKLQDTDMMYYYTGTFLGDALHMSLQTVMGSGLGPQEKFIATRQNTTRVYRTKANRF